MSADQTPGAPTEQEWGEALARAMYVEVPTETWQAFDASASRDAAARVAPALRPLIERERERARTEGMAAVAGPVLALADGWGTRGVVSRARAAEIRAAIPAEATEALARLRAQWQAEALREAADAWPREINGEVLRREAAVTMAELAEPYTEADWLRDRAARIAREAPSAFIDGDPLADEIIRDAQQDGGDRG